MSSRSLPAGERKHLRLLFAIKSLAAAGGGAERVLCDVASGLAARGHEVAIATYDPEGARTFYPLDERVRLIALGIGEPEQGTSLGETLRRLPVLRRLALDTRPDVVIGFMHSIYVPLALALAGTRVPLIASEHIVYQHYRTRPIERWLVQLAAPMFDAVTTISEATRASFPLRLARRMTVVPNPVIGVTRGHANVRGMPGQPKTVLTVGRLEEQKDHQTLIRAFARLAAEFPDWRLRIVGEGSLRQRLEAEVARTGLADRIERPGTVADVSSEYLGAQLFAISSSYESFGLATAEALAHGLPAVGFADCAGTNELIVDGQNGLLVAGPDRALALAEGLRKAMREDALRARLAERAPESVAAYSLDGVLDAWEQLLSSVRR